MTEPLWLIEMVEDAGHYRSAVQERAEYTPGDSLQRFGCCVAQEVARCVPNNQYSDEADDNRRNERAVLIEVFGCCWTSGMCH